MAIYLFYGEETYLLETRVKKIKKEYQQLILGINFIQVDDTNVEELIADLETPAFGFDKKLIIAKNTGIFKKEKKTTKSDSKKKKVDDTKLPLNEKIAKYIQENLEELKNTVDLVFVEQEVDKNALYQTIEKVGEVKEFALLKLPDLIANIKKIAVAYKVNIDDATAKYLVECCGTSMQDLINELRKLIEYKGENSNITKQDIDLLCTKQIQAVIFDLTDNLGKKETKRALEVLQNLIYNKEPIQKILINLYNHFKKLYFTKIALNSNKDLITSLNLKPNQTFLTGKYKTQSSYFKMNELKEILQELRDLDYNYKNGLIDLQVGLESILCRYC